MCIHSGWPELNDVNKFSRIKKQVRRKSETSKQKANTLTTGQLVIHLFNLQIFCVRLLIRFHAISYDFHVISMRFHRITNRFPICFCRTLQAQFGQFALEASALLDVQDLSSCASRCCCGQCFCQIDQGLNGQITMYSLVITMDTFYCSSDWGHRLNGFICRNDQHTVAFESNALGHGRRLP